MTLSAAPRISILLSTYNSENFLSHQLRSIQNLTIWKDAELIIAANDPNPAERDILARFEKKWPEQVTVMTIPRESLYASWNRCIHSSKAGLLAIANVDDIRTPQGLEQQVACLEKSPEASFCYGSFSIVNQFPSDDGSLISPPSFERLEFTRSMHLGPFFVWRKAVHEKIGYFDEQFRSGGDFDFAIRLAIQGKGVRIDDLLGYYYSAGTGLSTGSNLQPIERTVIELRYGNYDKLDYDFLPEALQYHIANFYWGGGWHSIAKIVPDYTGWIANRRQKWFELGMMKYVKRLHKRRIRQRRTNAVRQYLGPLIKFFRRAGRKH